MENLSFKAVLLCFCLLCIGDLSGWAIAYKMAGDVAGKSFLYFSAIVTITIFIVQLSVFGATRGRLVGQLLLRAFTGFSLVWFMLSLVLPVLWMQQISISAKGALLIISSILFGCNVIVGFRHFEKRWAEKSLTVEKFVNKKDMTIDWHKISKSLHLSVSVRIPGMPLWTEPILYIAIILSMIAGLNLRKVFPVFSVFAWGIPCVIASSAIIQMIAINFAQAYKLVDLEKKMGLKFRALA